MEMSVWGWGHRWRCERQLQQTGAGGGWAQGSQQAPQPHARPGAAAHRPEVLEVGAQRGLVHRGRQAAHKDLLGTLPAGHRLRSSGGAGAQVAAGQRARTGALAGRACRRGAPGHTRPTHNPATHRARRTCWSLDTGDSSLGSARLASTSRRSIVCCTLITCGQGRRWRRRGARGGRQPARQAATSVAGAVPSGRPRAAAPVQARESGSSGQAASAPCPR